MGRNISLYLSDDALAKLDAAVAIQAALDRASGKQGHAVANRSNLIEAMITEHLGKQDTSAIADRAFIEYWVCKLGKAYGAKRISLFGSYARGEQRPDSDIDILLDKGDIHGLQVLDFQDALAEKLERNVDVVTTTGASERFLANIAPESVVLYEAS